MCANNDFLLKLPVTCFTYEHGAGSDAGFDSALPLSHAGDVEITLGPSCNDSGNVLSVILAADKMVGSRKRDVALGMLRCGKNFASVVDPNCGICRRVQD